jgi:hypothetical protein
MEVGVGVVMGALLNATSLAISAAEFKPQASEGLMTMLLLLEVVIIGQDK